MEELLEKYKATPLLARFAIMAVVGLLYPAYMFNEESKKIEEEVSAAQQKLQTAKSTLAGNKKAKSDIPAQERILESTEKKLIEIKQSLPPAFEVHEILRLLATSSKENSTVLEEFNPTKPQDQTLYEELPFDLKVTGKFVNATRFIDSLLHFETLTRVSAIRYRPRRLPEEDQEISARTLQSEIASRKRRAEVDVNLTFVAFRSKGI